MYASCMLPAVTLDAVDKPERLVIGVVYRFRWARWPQYFLYHSLLVPRFASLRALPDLVLVLIVTRHRKVGVYPTRVRLVVLVIDLDSVACN